MKNRFLKYSTVVMGVLAGAAIFTTNVNADANDNAQSAAVTTTSAATTNASSAASATATSAAQTANANVAASSANDVSAASNTASSSANAPVAIAPAAVDSWGDTGRWHRTYDNNWTYTKSDGNRADAEWLIIDGAWYYFDGSGFMVTNGWHQAPWSGQYNNYYFDANGHYETNCWHAHRDSYSLDATTTWTYSKSNGTQAMGEWLWINGAWYYFDGSGFMVANGWHQAPWNGQYNNYYFDANGHYVTNCWHAKRDSDRLDATTTWTYSKSDGTQAMGEWLWINGAWYYFDGSGFMVANGWHQAPWSGQYNNYYFDANGHYVTNCWHAKRDSDRLDATTTWTYSKSNGTQAMDEWLWINGAWYYFDGSGFMVANGWHEEEWNGQYRDYYFDANGHCLN